LPHPEDAGKARTKDSHDNYRLTAFPFMACGESFHPDAQGQTFYGRSSEGMVLSKIAHSVCESLLANRFEALPNPRIERRRDGDLARVDSYGSWLFTQPIAVG